MTEVAGASSPELVGKYTLLRELGSREVPTYAARFEADAEAPALVILERYVTEESGDADDTLERAAREAEPLTALVHPNLAGIRAVMTTPHDVIVASDFVEGETYADLTKSKEVEARLPFRARLRVLLDVLEGLGAIHGVVHGARHRVHGDLAPDNVIVGVDGRARLVRVCNLFPEQVSPASPTLGFIAPELVQGASGTALVDARVDLYSAGVLLWEILTGKRLMVQTNSSALLLYELDRPPRGVPAEDLPWAKHLIDVAKRALAPSAERWSSAAEMASAISAVATEPSSIASADHVGAIVTRIAGEKIQARRAELGGLEPRPAGDARPSVTAKKGVRVPRALPEKPPLTPAPVAALAPKPPPISSPSLPTAKPASPSSPSLPTSKPAPIATKPSPSPPVHVPVPVPVPALPPSVRDEDLSASIVFPLHRKRHTLMWALAGGGAALLVLIGISYVAAKGNPAPATAGTPTPTAPSSLVPPGTPTDIPEPPASAAEIDIELPETIGPTGQRVRKRRRPAPPAPSTTTRKKFDPQGI